MSKFLLFFLFSSFLFAHKLNIFLYEENDKIVVNSYFSSGSPCKNCKVEIFDDNKKLLQTLQTDKKGNCILDKLSSKLFVKVEAIGGHAASSNIEVKNLKKSKKEISFFSSFLKSVLAIILIILIFIGLKRFIK